MKNSLTAFIISLLVHISVFAAILYTPIQIKEKETVILSMNMISEIVQTKKQVEQKQEVTTKEQKKQVEEKKIEKIQKKVEPVKKEPKPVKKIKKPKPKKKIVKKEPKKEIKKPVAKVRKEKPVKEVKKEPVEKVTSQKKQEESIKRVKSGENYQEKYIKTNLESIIAAIKKHKNYPYLAKKRGFEGKVVVQCTIMANGKIKDIKIIDECKYDILNKNSIKILKLASKEFEAPKKDVQLTIPFNYYLN
jgi:protein TonB